VVDFGGWPGVGRRVSKPDGERRLPDPMKTLVVEDNLMDQCLLAKVLADHGHEVVSFESAEQAILAYQKQFYPLLIADAALPGMGGLQFCKWIRSQPNGDKVFVLVATAPNHPANLGEVFDAGANDFIAKPLELGSLNARLSVAEREMKGFFERKDAERLLAESQDSFDRLVKTAREGVWWLDGDLRTEFANARMAELLGQAPEELEGRSVADFIPETLRSKAAGLFEEQKHAELRCEFALRRKDGTECPVLLAANPVLTPTGDSRGVLWLVTDLGPQRQIEAQLAETQAQRRLEVESLTTQLRTAAVATEQAASDVARLTEENQEARRCLATTQQQASAARGKAVEALRAETKRRRAVEEDLARVRRDLSARVAQLEAELTQSRKALEAETHRTQQAEVASSRTHSDLQAQLQKLGEQLARSLEDLKSEVTVRKELEAALRKAQEDIQLQALQHVQGLAEAGKSLQAEADERRRLTEMLQCARRDAEARAAQNSRELTELEQTVRATQQNLQEELTRHQEAVETEKRLRDELAQRERIHADEVQQLRQALGQTGEEQHRLKEALARAEADAEAGLKIASGEAGRVAEDLQREKAERLRAEEALRLSRDELATRSKQHTTELIEVNQHVSALMTERQRIDEELVKLRQQTGTRAKEQMDDMLKAADELRSLLAERRQLQRQVERLSAALRVADQQAGSSPANPPNLGVVELPATPDNPSQPALASAAP
jgi:PAS domain S-box-containing protein